MQYQVNRVANWARLLFALHLHNGKWIECGIALSPSATTMIKYWRFNSKKYRIKNGTTPSTVSLEMRGQSSGDSTKSLFIENNFSSSHTGCHQWFYSWRVNTCTVQNTQKSVRSWFLFLLFSFDKSTDRKWISSTNHLRIRNAVLVWLAIFVINKIQQYAACNFYFRILQSTIVKFRISETFSSGKRLENRVDIIRFGKSLSLNLIMQY